MSEAFERLKQREQTLMCRTYTRYPLSIVRGKGSRVWDIDGKEFTVTGVKRADKKRSAAPPFTTSTMLQEAARKLGFQSQRIMRIAQELYEGINIGSQNGGVQGLITYMRTDSLRVSTSAQEAAKEYITEKYGDKYCPSSPRNYKAKKGAQDDRERPSGRSGNGRTFTFLCKPPELS